jgi:hypothetical protein
VIHPDSHRDYMRQRHSDLLRQARSYELAKRIGEARDQERRTFLARLHLAQKPQTRTQPASS